MPYYTLVTSKKVQFKVLGLVNQKEKLIIVLLNEEVVGHQRVQTRVALHPLRILLEDLKVLAYERAVYFLHTTRFYLESILHFVRNTAPIKNNSALHSSEWDF